MKPDMHADQQGPTIQPKLAQLINKLWRKDRDSETYKQIMKKYPQTENLEAQEVELDHDGDGADADNLDEQQNAEMQQETAENSAEDDLLSAYETRYACWSARSHYST